MTLFNWCSRWGVERWWQSCDSRSQRRREGNLAFMSNWGTIYWMWFIILYLCALQRNAHTHLEGNNICWLMQTHPLVLSAIESSQISWMIIDPSPSSPKETPSLSLMHRTGEVQYCSKSIPCLWPTHCPLNYHQWRLYEWCAPLAPYQ